MKSRTKLSTTLASVKRWLLLSGALGTAIAPAAKTPLTSEQAAVVQTVTGVFDAVKTTDFNHFHSLVQPDFYVFDNGKRLDGDAILNFIKQLEASGKSYEWRITDPDVHVEGAVAWVAYINKGSVSDRSGTTPLQWLESAFLVREAGHWKIAFMHSTRVPKS